MKVAQVFVANVVPLMLALKMRTDAQIMEIVIPPFGAGEHPGEPNVGYRNSITTTFSGPPKPKPTPERLSKLFEKLNLKGDRALVRSRTSRSA